MMGKGERRLKPGQPAKVAIVGLLALIFSACSGSTSPTPTSKASTADVNIGLRVQIRRSAGPGLGDRSSLGSDALVAIVRSPGCAQRISTSGSISRGLVDSNEQPRGGLDHL